MTGVQAAEIGAGVLAAAAVAGAAGYYFYGTKNAKKHQHAASSWAKGLKRDVLKQAKALKHIDAKTVAKVVDQAAAAYKTAKGVNAKDLAHATSELKSNWNSVKRELAPSAAVKKAVKKVTKAVAPAKKAVKKAVKKATKKTAKKK